MLSSFVTFRYQRTARVLKRKNNNRWDVCPEAASGEETGKTREYSN